MVGSEGTACGGGGWLTDCCRRRRRRRRRCVCAGGALGPRQPRGAHAQQRLQHLRHDRTRLR
eukprot:COSAG01_NODE_743_length_13881_cov_8.038456_4_plen_61_part_01